MAKPFSPRYLPAMKKRSPFESPGQLAFVLGEHAETVMPAAWRMALHDYAEQSEVRSRFEAFRDRTRSLDRHRLLSLTGLYTLTGSVGALQRKAAYAEVAELEFLQAVALSGVEPTSPPHLPPEEVMPFWRELMSQCYVASQGEKSDETPEIEGRARIQAAYYRNPYGNEFFDRMMLAITKEYDERYLRDGSLARAGEAIVAIRGEIWRRFLEYNAAGRVALTSGRAKILEMLRRVSPGMVDEAFDAAFGSLRKEDLRRKAFNVVEDEAVDNLFLFNDDWIKCQENIGLPMTSVLDCLSLTQTNEIDGIELAAANPVWSAPIVKTRAGYALYSPITLASFPFRCLFSLLCADPQAKARVEKIRGWFVEQEGKRLLEKALPSAQVVISGYWYRTPAERIEADLLVLLADRLFIFEAKGAIIPDRVRFGARDATVNFLKSIWGKATKQGAALADHLENAEGSVVITNNKSDVVMTLDPTKIRSISRFGISIEQVGPLMNAPDMLRAAGVLNQTVVAAPCILLSEMAQVFEHATDELHRAHYLLRRSQVATTHELIGDEMDIYTTYIQFGFSDLPDSDRAMMLLGASYTLDDYRDREGVVHLPSDSALRCSPYFQKVLRHAEKRRSPGYLEIGLMLLDMPYRQQQELERQLDKMSRKRPKAEDWPALMVAIEAPGEKSALVVVVVNDSTSTLERRTVGTNLATRAGAQWNADQAACIVRLWREKDAYDALYLFGSTLAGVRARRATTTTSAI